MQVEQNTFILNVLRVSDVSTICLLNLSICKAIKVQGMWGVDLQLHSLLVVALDGGESSALRSGLLNPRVNCNPPFDCTGSWMSRQTLCGHFGEEKVLSPLLRIEPRFLGCTARNTSLLF